MAKKDKVKPVKPPTPKLPHELKKEDLAALKEASKLAKEQIKADRIAARKPKTPLPPRPVKVKVPNPARTPK